MMEYWLWVFVLELREARLSQLLSALRRAASCELGTFPLGFRREAGDLWGLLVLVAGTWSCRRKSLCSGHEPLLSCGSHQYDPLCLTRNLNHIPRRLRVTEAPRLRPNLLCIWVWSVAR
jgi:hypothetical protein